MFTNLTASSHLELSEPQKCRVWRGPRRAPTSLLAKRLIKPPRLRKGFPALIASAMFTIAGDPLNFTSWSVEFEEKQKHFPGAPPAMAGRSDAMGPEPECVAMGMMTATGKRLGSIRVESTGGIYVHSISTRNYPNGCSSSFGDLACSET